MYIDYILTKRSNKSFIDPNTLEPEFVKSSTDDILRLVYVPDPLTGVPQSDLVLLSHNNLAPEVFDMITKITQQLVSSVNTPFNTDKDAFESIVPYFLDNETQIMDFYKARGFDTERIEALLSGDSLDSISNTSDDSSAE